MSEHGTAAAVPSRGRLAGHAVLAAISLVALVIAVRLGLWRQNSPGEGLFPFLMALAMAVFSVAGLLGDLRERAAAQGRFFGDRPGLVRVVAYLGALVFYAGSLEPLGFIVASAITLVFILRFAERYRWLASLALTVGTVIGCQILFVLWLGANLPTGTLWADLLGR